MNMSTPPSKKKYDMKYQKENIVRIAFALNKNTDAEVIEKLRSVENKNAYIKQLILDERSRGD